MALLHVYILSVIDGDGDSVWWAGAGGGGWGGRVGCVFMGVWDVVFSADALLV